MNWSEFRQQLSLAFNEDELETLCFDLGIDYDNLSGENKNAKIRELIEQVEREGQREKLVAALNERRSHLKEKWDSVLALPPLYSFTITSKERQWILGAAVVAVATVAVIIFLIFNNRPDPQTAANELLAVVDTPTSESSTNTPTSTPTSALAPSSTPSATATLTTQPPPTNTPTATIPPTPSVAPVGTGEYMVLVAQLEPLTTNERDVTRFIVDDLTQILEVAIPFSNARIRPYPEIITSNSQAIAVAEETGAVVIVWGNYDDEVADVEVQIGSLAAFPGMLFDRQILEQTLNVRTQLTNPRQESLAPWVYNIILTVELAANISIAQSVAVLAEIHVILDRTGKVAAPLVGAGVSVRLHQYADTFYKGDITGSISYLDDALALGGGNALLYFFRGGGFLQTGEFQKATVDLETAARLGPNQWFSPHEGLGFIALLQNDLQDALTQFEKGVQWLPEQWLSFYYRGLVYFLAGEYDLARADFAQAIDLEPDVNWPYVFAMQVAMRQGRLLEAISLGNTVLTEFPDPDYGNRILEAGINNTSVIGPIISGMTNGLLQQWPRVLLDVDEVLAVNDQIPDAYWLQGFAHCNQDNYEAAEASYTTAVTLDPTFILPYLSRAAVRLQQGNTEGAEADFQMIANSELSAEFAPIIPFVRSGQLNCHNFLTFGQ